MTKYLFLLPTLTGCIIVEGEKSERENWDESDSGWDESDWEDSEHWEGDDYEEDEESEEDTPGPENVDGTYYTVPSEAAPGDVFLSALRSDDAIDWSQIVSITPYGDVTICNFIPLYDELLLTVKVTNEAPEGTVDLIVEYSNGDIDLVEDGFVIDTNADVGSAATDPSACD